MSQFSPWKGLLAPCSTWRDADSGASWRAGCPKWSLNLICPTSSRTTCCWSTEATSTESTGSYSGSLVQFNEDWVLLYGRNRAAVRNMITAKITTRVVTSAVETIHQLTLDFLTHFIRFHKEQAAACSLSLVPHLSAQIHVFLLHHKRELSTRVVQVQ